MTSIDMSSGNSGGQLAAEKRLATVTKHDFAVDGPNDSEFISWKKVQYFIQGVEEVIRAKDHVARDALNESETLKWILEEEKEKFRESFEEIAFLNQEIRKLSIEKSETLQKMQHMERENANLKEQLVIAQLQLEQTTSPSPSCSPYVASTDEAPLYTSDGKRVLSEITRTEKKSIVGVEKRLAQVKVSPTALFHTPELVRDQQKSTSMKDENVHYTMSSQKID